jgi:hypothetical protein
METGLEELRILQTLLLILTTTKIVTGDSFAKVKMTETLAMI